MQKSVNTSDDGPERRALAVSEGDKRHVVKKWAAGERSRRQEE